MSSRACRCPKCQPPRLATRPPGPSVQASRASFTPPVHRHGTSSLTFTSPSTTASVLHTCTTQAKRHVAHKAFAKVELVTTQPTSWVTLIITHHKMNTQRYLSTLCSHLTKNVEARSEKNAPGYGTSELGCRTWIGATPDLKSLLLRFTKSTPVAAAYSTRHMQIYAACSEFTSSVIYMGKET
jgi:hypothetical protein